MAAALVAAVSVVAVLLAGCAGSAGREAVDSGGATSVGVGAEPMPAVGAPAQVGEATAAPAEAPAVDGASGGSSTTAVDTQKIIRTGALSLEVPKLDEAVAAAESTIKGVGGYVSGTNAGAKGEVSYASITFRIPADRWDEALAALKKLASKVLNEQTNAVEVTGQIVDLDARLRNLKATETALLDVMTKATRITDILAVQEQLTTVQGEIERLTSQRAALADQVALGTLTVDFSEPYVAVDVQQDQWDPGKQVDQAVAALVAFGQNLASAGIWLVIVVLPALVVVILILAIVLFVLRVIGRRLPGGRKGPPAAGDAGSAGPASGGNASGDQAGT